MKLSELTVVVDQASLYIFTPGAGELDMSSISSNIIDHLETPKLRTMKGT